MTENGRKERGIVERNIVDYSQYAKKPKLHLQEYPRGVSSTGVGQQRLRGKDTQQRTPRSDIESSLKTTVAVLTCTLPLSIL